MKKAILLSTLAITITSCAVKAKNDGVMQAQERTSGIFGLNTNDSVEVETASAFKNANEVVIGGFKVAFSDSKKLQNEAKGSFLGGGGWGGKSTGLVKLENVPDSTKQAITDAAYNDFVANLEAKGYTVHPRSKFTSSKAYTENGTKEYDFPYENDSSGFLSSYGVAHYFSPAAIGSKQPIFLGEIDGVTGGFAFANPMNAAAEFGEETGIAVLNITYFMDFAGAGGHAGITSSSLEVGQLLSVDQGRVGIQSGHGGTFSNKAGAMTLGQPIASDKEFATIETTTSDVAAGAEIAVNLASALLGGGTSSSKEFVFKADPAKFSSAAIDALKKANEEFVGKMSSLK